MVKPAFRCRLRGVLSSPRRRAWSRASFGINSRYYFRGITLAGARRPSLPDQLHTRRVDEEAAEGPDQRQVERAKPAARLDEDTHLSSIQPSALVDPNEVFDSM